VGGEVGKMREGGLEGLKTLECWKFREASEVIKCKVLVWGAFFVCSEE
jgi:hypothetical protein